MTRLARLSQRVLPCALLACSAPAPAPDPEPAPAVTLQTPRASTTVAARDQAVLDRVLRDLLSTDSGHTPVSVRGRPPDLLPVASYSKALEMSPLDLVHLREYEPAAWSRCPEASLADVEAAAADLVERARTGFTGFSSDVEGVCMVEPTEERRPLASLSERPVHARLPGYSPDETLAVVQLWLPWSIHVADATYVLRAGPDGWDVLVRQFVYHP